MALEVLLGASPGYFRPEAPEAAGTWDASRMESWCEASATWLKQYFGPGLISVTLHLDESTPHMHALVMPLDSNGRLNAKAITGGRQRMAALQSSYAEACRPLGLARGIPGSTASHVDIKDWYAALNRPVPALQIPPVDPPGFFDRKTYAKEQTLKIKSAVNERLKLLVIKARAQAESDRKRKEYQETASKLADENERLREQSRELERELDRLKKRRDLADRMRELPLEGILAELGYKAHKQERIRWRAEGSTISVKGRKWFDREASADGKGGYGTIDLVIHVLKCNFKDAMSWLADRYGPDEAVAIANVDACDACSQSAATIARTIQKENWNDDPRQRQVDTDEHEPEFHLER